MTILNTVKKILGIKPVSIGELNRRVTREAVRESPPPPAKDSLEGIVIPEQYEQVRALLEAGCPIVFVYGNAGTGKSTLIRYLRCTLTKKMVVVAPTGVAALNAAGVTIHSFFHLPPKIHEDEDIKLLYDRKLYQKLELLIIDEVSMVRCDLMDSVDKFLRKNRFSDAPFGGVQLLLVGDLFQLPPVLPKHERDVLRAKGYTSRYFFSSFSLREMSLVPLELTFVYRQQDTVFVNLLNCIRIGDNLDFATDEVNKMCFLKDDFSTDITLVCTNNAADQINMKELMNIPEKEYAFKGKIEGEFRLEEDKLPSPIDLRLKVGARVMFTKNDYQRRWVNGTLGIVRHIDKGYISVELVTDSRGSIFDVQPVTWETYKYAYDSQKDQIVARIVGRYTQYPLMLAWAVTIHKSQGKTLEKVMIDLGHGAFDSGQVYVAVSRCRSIEAIRLARPIRKVDVKCDPMIKQFYLELDEMKK